MSFRKGSSHYMFVGMKREDAPASPAHPFENGSIDHNNEVYDLWRSGQTLAEIGRRFGISRQRVSQIVRRARSGFYQKKDEP